jgi:hypothetical protein
MDSGNAEARRGSPTWPDHVQNNGHAVLSTCSAEWRRLRTRLRGSYVFLGRQEPLVGNQSFRLSARCNRVSANETEPSILAMTWRSSWVAVAPPPKGLSLPTSKHTELCYAFEGKAHTWRPLTAERVELLLIDQERHRRWVISPARLSPDYPVDENVDGWRVLGWRLPSGQLRHGEYDVVDPELADFERLPLPNSKTRGA